MTDLKLDIAFWNYDRTRALSDGKVRIPGVDAKYHSGSNVAEIFRGMVAEDRFDVAELGLTYFLRTFKEGESPFVAIPVFPVRAFRHSAIFVNANSGIKKPEDLNGKTIGNLPSIVTTPASCRKACLWKNLGSSRRRAGGSSAALTGR